MLALSHYRDEIALDVPFVHPTALSTEQRLETVQWLLAALHAEGIENRLPVQHRERLDARERLNALLTIRPSHPFPPGLLDRVDSLLQHERPEPAVAAMLPRWAAVSEQCALWRGDITTLAIDAIVNAANSDMLGCFVPFHRCIDNAIHAAAGPRLRQDCARIMRQQGTPEPTGHAKATRGYNLPSRYVIHTVGPQLAGELQSEHSLALASAYRACLELTSQLEGARSIAFCSVSTGVFGFPKVPAARIALETVRRWLAENPGALDLVVFNVFAADDAKVYQSVAAELQS